MSENTHFSADMTVSNAMSKHPRAAEVFAAFHLGGCAHCHVNAYETIGQVCEAYGVEVAMLLEVLEGLFENEAGANA